MNLEYFIARRISGSRQGVVSSRVMVRIAAISVAVSIAVMVIAMGVVAGFQKEIAYKVTGLTADITLTARAPGNPFEIIPTDYDSSLVEALSEMKGVRNVQQYINSAAIMQNGTGMQGVSIKGVGADYDWSFISGHLTAGRIPAYADSARSRELVVSRTLAGMLDAEPGDVVNIISVGENARRDRFRISGIYDSGIEEFDSNLIFADINTVRRIQRWEESTVDGYEIRLDDPQSGDAVRYHIESAAAAFGEYRTETVRERQAQIYDWLDMLNMNTAIVIVIMFIVAGVNMICGILIIVLDSARMIGVLSSQGMMRGSIQKIFIYRSMYITLVGMFFGNLLGLALALAQQWGGFIRLDATAYMVSSVPVTVDWGGLLLLNAGVFAAITLLTVLPTMIISKITPEKSIRFQ